MLAVTPFLQFGLLAYLLKVEISTVSEFVVSSAQVVNNVGYLGWRLKFSSKFDHFHNARARSGHADLLNRLDQTFNFSQVNCFRNQVLSQSAYPILRMMLIVPRSLSRLICQLLIIDSLLGSDNLEQSHSPLEIDRRHLWL